MPANRQQEIVQRLFLEHHNQLRGFVLGLCCDRSAADDIVQETFLTATAKAGDFTPGTDFLAWVRSIARYKILEHFGRRPPAAALSAEAWHALAESVVEIDDSWESRRVALGDCIAQLPARSRQLIELRYSPEKPDMASIAAQIGWTIGAVKVGLSRAREALWRCLEQKTSAELQSEISSYE